MTDSFGPDGPTPFPLVWPPSWPRTETWKRTSKAYKVTASAAREGLFAAIRRLEARRTVLSSNIPLRLDGKPYAEFREPADPGVAVYWLTHQGVSRVIACDRWKTVRENSRAVTLAIEAFRALERSGAGQVVERMAAGLLLPERAGVSYELHWSVILGTARDASESEIRRAYRGKVLTAHPDVTGNREQWNRVQEAFEAARQERGFEK